MLHPVTSKKNDYFVNVPHHVHVVDIDSRNPSTDKFVRMSMHVYMSHGGNLII